MTMRKCRECGISESETYISKRLLCEQCAIAIVTRQVRFGYQVAQGLPSVPSGNVAGGLRRSIANMTALHVDAVRRKDAAKKTRAVRRKVAKAKTIA